MKARIQGKRNEQSGVPRIGRIKIGDKRKNSAGKEYPVGLDYFRATGKYASRFNAMFDEPPSSLTITFHSDDLSDVCVERLEILDSRGDRVAWGDGCEFMVWNGAEYAPMHVEDAPDLMDRIAERTGTDWYTVLEMRFLIPRMTGVFGHWLLSTKAAASSIPQITSTVDRVLESAGTLWRVPFDLQVEKVKSWKPGKKNTYPVLRIVPNISEESLNLLAEFAPGQIGARGLLTEEQIRQAATKLLSD